ncbi:hypothetical protein Patl1_30422 [Pistacia atlantica]|uniref:Uncharacterized protein n=1 Tax=Pistacia atlantica TaxID=434234 RepID=A0ACC1A703_9ROSI|nr:hypothetical protein Patl1_30422 [Pistacia atlantica]
MASRVSEILKGVKPRHQHQQPWFSSTSLSFFHLFISCAHSASLQFSVNLILLIFCIRTELCRFSGAKIYPGKGIRFVRSDSQVFLFANSKCKRYFHNRLKPSKLTWTAMYRKQHKKDIAAEAVKKKRRSTKKPYSRSIVGATLEVIQKRRTEKPEVRDAAREAALREIKERIKKTKDEKKAKKAEVMAKTQKTKSSMPKGRCTKGPQAWWWWWKAMIYFISSLLP